MPNFFVDSFRKIFIGGTLYSHTPSPNSELTQTKSIIIVIEHRDDQTKILSQGRLNLSLRTYTEDTASVSKRKILKEFNPYAKIYCDHHLLSLLSVIHLQDHEMRIFDENECQGCHQVSANL